MSAPPIIWSWRRIFVFRLGTYAAGVGLLSLAAGAFNSRAFTTVLGVFVVGTVVYVQRRFQPDPGKGRETKGTAVAIVFLIVLGVLVTVSAWGAAGGQGRGIVRSVLVFAGIATALLGLSSLSLIARYSAWRWLWWSLGGLNLVVLVVGAAMLGHGMAGVVVLVVGLAMLPMTGAVVAEWAIRLEAVRRRGWPGSALVLCLVGWLGLWRRTGLGLLGLLVALLVVAAFVAGIVHNSALDALIVLVLVAAAWASAPTTVSLDHAAPQLLVDPTQPYFAAIGDSYMSGEGAPSFFTGTNSIGVNECRRAPTAYTALLAKPDDPSDDSIKPTGARMLDERVPAPWGHLAAGRHRARR